MSIEIKWLPPGEKVTVTATGLWDPKLRCIVNPKEIKERKREEPPEACTDERPSS